MLLHNDEQILDENMQKNAIKQLVFHTWNISNKESLSQLVEDVYAFGQKLGFNQFDSGKISMLVNTQLLEQMKTERYLDEKSFEANLYDNGYKHYLSSFILKLERLIKNELGNISYEKYMPELLNVMQSRFESLKSARPKEYKSFLEEKELTMEKTTLLKDMFSGYNPKAGIGYVHHSLPENIEKSMVKYGVERGRNPFETLLGAIVADACNLQIHNQTVKMMQELKIILQTPRDKIKLNHIESNPLRVLTLMSLNHNDLSKIEQDPDIKAMLQIKMPPIVAQEVKKPTPI